jgi:hypothetical protein
MDPTDIEIFPSAVMRSAASVEAAGRQLAGGGDAGDPGNEGFMTSDAIRQFASRMQQTTDQAAADTSAAAEKLDGSAKLLRSVDDDVSARTRALWPRAL